MDIWKANTVLYSCTSVTQVEYDDVRHICVILLTRFLHYFAQTMRIQSTVVFEMATKPKMGGGKYSVKFYVLISEISRVEIFVKSCRRLFQLT